MVRRIRSKADLTKKNIKALKSNGVAVIVISIIFTIIWMVGYYYNIYFGIPGSFFGFIISTATAATYHPSKVMAKEKSTLKRARGFLIFYLIVVCILQLVLIPVTYLYVGYLIWAMVGLSSIIVLIPASIGIGLSKKYKKMYKKNVVSLNKTLTNVNISGSIPAHVPQTAGNSREVANGVRTGNTSTQPLDIQPTTYMQPNMYPPTAQTNVGYALDYPVIDEPIYTQGAVPPNNVQNEYYQNPYQIGNIYTNDNRDENYR